MYKNEKYCIGVQVKVGKRSSQLFCHLAAYDLCV
jgi:hypothetical protein